MEDENEKAGLTCETQYDYVENIRELKSGGTDTESTLSSEKGSAPGGGSSPRMGPAIGTAMPMPPQEYPIHQQGQTMQPLGAHPPVVGAPASMPAGYV